MNVVSGTITLIAVKRGRDANEMKPGWVFGMYVTFLSLSHIMLRGRDSCF